jgi:TBC1 domain family member 20
MLCYFQGYHDIVQVLLLVLGEQIGPAAVARISLLRIRDYMLPSLSPALKHLQLLPAILQSADFELARRLSHTRPFFALSATLTLYAHDIQEYGDIARVYDFILAHEPVMSIYLFAAIIISRRSELLDVPIDEPEMLHFTLSKLPQPLKIETLISKSLLLFKNHPPERLPGFIWWKMSSLSVLKTSSSLKKKQTLKDGEELFRQQVRQMRRQEVFEKTLLVVSQHKRPIASVAVALLVGAVSIWLRKGANERFWSQIWHTFESVTRSR